MDNIEAKLYLDVDGVILPFLKSDTSSMPFEMKQANGIECYSPDVVARLGKTSLTLVWCTTWNKLELEVLTDNMGALQGGHQLYLPETSNHISRISQKLNAIIADQADNSSPFVWAEDDITATLLRRSARIFRNTPHLIVQPDRTLGINESQLLAIEKFASLHSST